MTEAERRSLQDAMARLADGDRSAFPGVFQVLWPFLSAFSRRVLSEPADAEDAAQHALLKVFEHASRFDPSRDAATWALAITANECRASRRRRGRLAPLPASVPELADAAPGPEASAVERDLIAAAAAVLGELPPQDLATLREAWANERPDVPAATFRKRLQRATTRLRAAWRARHGAA